MDYLKFSIPAAPDQQEILIALLAELPFDSFQGKRCQIRGIYSRGKFFNAHQRKIG